MATKIVPGIANSDNPLMLKAVSAEAYDAAATWCYQVVSQGHDLLFDQPLYLEEIHAAASRFRFPLQSLQSLLRNIHLIHVKKSAHRVKHLISNKHLLLQDYQRGMSMVALAKQINYPPYLFARYMVEAMTASTVSGKEQQTQGKKFNVADAMRYPESKLVRDVIVPLYLPSEDQFYRNQLLEGNRNDDKTMEKVATTRLALEVRAAMECDPIYGPQSDKERHLVGIEFEVVLEQSLNDLGIPFETEAQLRQRGASRTPDVLLSFPVAVQVPKGDGFEWRMVCWIDSKALFGDVNTHHTSVLPQLETYVHRFGPGLVIYWMGHAPLERLGDAQGDVIIVGWDLPAVFLLPDGTSVSSSSSSK